MDTLSSSDLDSSSKTPLFVAIAAVIVGLAGLGLGWLGFSKASQLESKISGLESGLAGLPELEQTLADSGRRSDQVSANMAALSQEVNRVLKEIQNDVASAKRDIRSVAIEAGTNRKKIEELEKAPPAAVPAPRPSASQSDAAASGGSGGSGGPSAASDAAPEARAGGVYTIKSGDTLARIASQYKISLDALLQANPGVEPRALRVGQQIVIPASQ